MTSPQPFRTHLWPRTAQHGSGQVRLMLSRRRPRGKVAAWSPGTGGVWWWLMGKGRMNKSTCLGTARIPSKQRRLHGQAFPRRFVRARPSRCWSEARSAPGRPGAQPRAGGSKSQPGASGPRGNRSAWCLTQICDWTLSWGFSLDYLLGVRGLGGCVNE